MGIGHWLLPKGAEESVFKPVAGGWVLSGAKTPVFGSRQAYVVAEAQKPAIAAKIRKKMYVNLAMAVVGVGFVVAAGIKFNWWLSATPKEFAVGAALLVVLNVIMAASDHLLMRPIVRDLPRSADRVGMLDRWRSISRSMSTTNLAFFVIFFVVAAAGNLYTAAVQKQVIGWICAPVLILFAVAYGYALVLKLRGTRAVDAG